jgi:flagellar basal-body rod protein FlgC
MSVLSIASSGLAAASLRLQVSASNVANSQSNGPLPGSPNAAKFPPAYVPQRVDQVAGAGGGTVATATAVPSGTVPQFDPTAPYANQDGLVASPNVDPVNEALQQITARFDFSSNAKVIGVESEMMKTLLDIKV